MRCVAAIAVMLMLAGCDQGKPLSKEEAAKARAAEARINEIVAGNPGLKKSCVAKDVHGQAPFMWWADNPECYDMLPQQHWSGLWEDGWEWSNFCADPAKVCDWMDKPGTWLIFAKDSHHGPELDGTYRIEFIGRRTRSPGYFGHQAFYDHLIIADRMISIEKIPGQKYTRR